MRELTGGCHCGAVSYVFVWPRDEDPAVRKCGCSFCRKIGVVYTAHPRASLSLTMNTDAVSRYQFETRTAWGHFCARCGVYVYASTIVDGREYAVLNANTLSNVTLPAEIETLSFDDESLEMRVARRTRTWIGDVARGR